MRRSSLVLVVCLVAAVTRQPAHAGWYEFWHRFHLDFHRNNAWPEPFASIDEQAAKTAMDQMVVKGWLRQNTIGQYHFDPATQQLTEAGQLKLRWIVTQVPPDQRVVVVVRGDTDEISAVRLDSVQQAAAKILPNGPLPEVRLTDVEERGWPADNVNDITLKAKELMRPPVLKEKSINY